MTLGSQDLARVIGEWHNGAHHFNQKPPSGFRHIGTGSYRTAYLHEDSNLVYKCGTYWCNIAESYMARRLINRSQRELDVRVRIPRTTTYRIRNYANPSDYRDEVLCRVVVQEYAENTHDTHCTSWDYVSPCDCYGWNGGRCYRELWEYLGRWAGLSDMHHENIRHNRDTNEFWIIDLAC